MFAVTENKCRPRNFIRSTAQRVGTGRGLIRHERRFSLIQVSDMAVGRVDRPSAGRIDSRHLVQERNTCRSPSVKLYLAIFHRPIRRCAACREHEQKGVNKAGWQALTLAAWNVRQDKRVGSVLRSTSSRILLSHLPTDRSPAQALLCNKRAGRPPAEQTDRPLCPGTS